MASKFLVTLNINIYKNKSRFLRADSFHSEIWVDFLPVRQALNFLKICNLDNLNNFFVITDKN